MELPFHSRLSNIYARKMYTGMGIRSYELMDDGLTLFLH